MFHTFVSSQPDHLGRGRLGVAFFSVATHVALAILQAKDRIPVGSFIGGKVYNFWQDEDHVRGIWRRTSLESYSSGKPEWETVLDIDALSRAEGLRAVPRMMAPLAHLRPPGASENLLK